MKTHLSERTVTGRLPCGSSNKSPKTEQPERVTCLRCRRLVEQRKARLEAAEEVCWSLMLMIDLGGLDIDEGWRKVLGEPLQKWAHLAASTKVLLP